MPLLSTRAVLPLCSPISHSLSFPCRRFFGIAFSSSPTSSSVSMSSSSVPQVIEHTVLFKVKSDADSSQVSAMLNGLNSLVSMDSVVHLAAGPVRRCGSSMFSFTHMLHSRYKSKEDLSAYSAHPDHLRVVKDAVLPVCDDIMALDWVADCVPETLVPPSGAAVKFTFMKLKEDATEESKAEIFGVIKGLKEKFGGIDQITCGLNFSPGRAKGFSIASLAVFKNLSELEAADSMQELANLEKDKVRDYIDGVFAIDFVVPSSSNL